MSSYVCPECGQAYGNPGNCQADQTPLALWGEDPIIGQTVGSYRVAKLLGAGGMGRVYKAVQPNIGSRVAIKVLSLECASDRTLVERFFSEARAVNVIRHENIVNVIDLGTLADGRPYIVMEYLDGAPFAAVIKKRHPLPLGGVVRLIEEVLDALGAAHGHGIVHRDLKPDNIFVSPAGHGQVLDFGIAKLDPGQLGGQQQATRAGTIMGTPHFMSPEQAQARPVDARSDLYSMGVILYEAMTGQLPFTHESLFMLLRMHCEQPPRPPRELRPDMPPQIEQVILRAMAKDPAQRFQSAQEMAQALAAASQALPADAWASLGTTSAIATVGPPSFTSIPPTGQRPMGVGPQTMPPATHIGAAPPPRQARGFLIGLGVMVLVGGGAAGAYVAMQGKSSSNSKTPPAQVADNGNGLQVKPNAADPPPPPAIDDATLSLAGKLLDQGLKQLDKKDVNDLANTTIPQPDQPKNDPPQDQPNDAPLQPASTGTGTIDLAHFDAVGYIARARATAAQQMKHPTLVMITLMNVGPDGRANLSSGSATYMFTDKVGGAKPCSLIVSVTAMGVNAFPQDMCMPQEALKTPSCTGARLAKKLNLGASGKAESLSYMNLGNGMGCKWTGMVGGQPRLIDDDCD